LRGVLRTAEKTSSRETRGAVYVLRRPVYVDRVGEIEFHGEPCHTERLPMTRFIKNPTELHTNRGIVRVLRSAKPSLPAYA